MAMSFSPTSVAGTAVPLTLPLRGPSDLPQDVAIRTRGRRLAPSLQAAGPLARHRGALGGQDQSLAREPAFRGGANLVPNCLASREKIRTDTTPYDTEESAAG